jgi:hypothetical protein
MVGIGLDWIFKLIDIVVNPYTGGARDGHGSMDGGIQPPAKWGNGPG